MMELEDYVLTTDIHYNIRFRLLTLLEYIRISEFKEFDSTWL